MVDESQFSKEEPPREKPEIPEPVWTFRGYQLRPSEFNTAMVHYYRAEITRCNVWRQRLDMTTNWAVITTGAAITIAFAETGFHGVIILNTLLITLFLMMEARRYRYRTLQTMMHLTSQNGQRIWPSSSASTRENSRRASPI